MNALMWLRCSVSIVQDTNDHLNDIIAHNILRLVRIYAHVQGDGHRCRSLTHTHRRGYYQAPPELRFPTLAAMPRLTHLHISCCMNDEAVLENLVSLHDLQELCVRYMQNGLFREVVISPAAGLTKLTVHRCQVRRCVWAPCRFFYAGCTQKYRVCEGIA